MEEMSIEAIDKAELSLAKPRCALCDHIEDRLRLCRRATNNVQNLAVL
jgi:hypothetical protein